MCRDSLRKNGTQVIETKELATRIVASCMEEKQAQFQPLKSLSFPC
jgi:hypothetical protein